ncbi:MAG: DUF3830 family protein [Chloroflexota bacterium]|nr:DUF3830 family protein [Chloroflexota bacterium]MDE3193640.1 DUF3830 family protein [Chloroflexota bacterium]
MTYLDISFSGLELRARLLEDRAPHATAAFRTALPISTRAYQDRYSAQLMRTDAQVAAQPGTDSTWGYQQPGLVMLDAQTGRVAVCFGRGRLQNSLGPLPAVPIAEIGGDLAELTRRGDRLQFEGAKPIEFRLSRDQAAPLADAPARGRRIAITLARARAEAVLLEDVSPKTTAAFAAALPASGKATNTYASGPLTRFWNGTGGKEGETPLDVPDAEATATTLYGGGYYLTTKPWRGLRISAQEPTAMGAGRMALAPLFRFVGDWSAFRDATARLTLEGEKDMRIELA